MAALAALLVLSVAACDPVKGQECSHEGNVWAGHGRSLTCTRTDNGLRWQ
jgi:hypothetical protein